MTEIVLALMTTPACPNSGGGPCRAVGQDSFGRLVRVCDMVHEPRP